jgi:hypothetical protein
LYAFLLPFGAPGDVPPCIRQRPFFIAGDWHGVWCIGKLCMGLIS